MTTYNVAIDPESKNLLLRLSFGAPAQNDAIVRDAVAAVKALNLEGGPSVRLNGAVTVAVGMAIAHELCHKYGYVAMYDPKLPEKKYVVVISHDPNVRQGDCVE